MSTITPSAAQTSSAIDLASTFLCLRYFIDDSSNATSIASVTSAEMHQTSSVASRTTTDECIKWQQHIVALALRCGGATTSHRERVWRASFSSEEDDDDTTNDIPSEHLGIDRRRAEVQRQRCTSLREPLGGNCPLEALRGFSLL